jgi:hypothetical protein
MAQTLQSSQPGRISQHLPAVKCSNCNASVPLTELGEHICAPAPPLPKVPPSPSSLLPSRLQGLVSRRSQKAQAPQSNVLPQPQHVPPFIQAPLPARLNSPGPVTPPFGQPNPGQLGPGWGQNRVPSPLSSQDRGGPSHHNLPIPQRMRTTSDSRREPPRPFAERERTLSTGHREPYSPQPPPSPGLRTKTPPNDRRAPGTPLRPSFDHHPYNDSRVPSAPILDNRRPSDARAPSIPIRPSFDSRPSNDARVQNTTVRPSLDIRQPNDPRGPSAPLRPSIDNGPINDTRSPSTRPSVDKRPPVDTRPSFDSVRGPPRQGSYSLEQAPMPPRSPVPSTAPAPPRSPAPRNEPDTKVGGDAGMAGVGRRGFAAVARAAMFAHAAGQGGAWHDGDGAESIRRLNTPQYLEINTASSYCEFLSFCFGCR